MDLCEILCTELFSVCWETRHGAATLLREIIKHCGWSAGVVSPDNVRVYSSRRHLLSCGLLFTSTCLFKLCWVIVGSRREQVLVGKLCGQADMYVGTGQIC